MARKNYSEEFRRDAVELYRVTEGATVKQIAEDLGVVDGTLSSWLHDAGVPIRGRRKQRGGDESVDPETPDEELARLRRRVDELEATETKLTTERDILRKAAKFFAGETNW